MRDLALPLRHEAAIREQARDKGLDPSLIAGVIYAESKFSDSTSPAGALGLMQLMPATAHFIAQRSGGTRFTTEDLSTPTSTSPTAAGICATCSTATTATRCSRWPPTTAARRTSVAGSPTRGARGESFGIDDIRFAETRAYVDRVLDARRDYRATYADELGIGSGSRAGAERGRGCATPAQKVCAPSSCENGPAS